MNNVETPLLVFKPPGKTFIGKAAERLAHRAERNYFDYAASAAESIATFSEAVHLNPLQVVHLE